MKQLLLLTVLLISISLHAQIVNIPDANFKDILVNHEIANLEPGYVYGENYTVNSVVDTNGDGEIQVSEAENVYGISFSEVIVSSLEGIEYFTNLEYLNVDLIDVSAVDLDNNVNLKYLTLSSNNLTEIDLNNNVNLEFLSIGGSQLINVNLQNCVNLFDLGIGDSIMSSIDISNNILLETISLVRNLFVSLDLSNNTNLVNVVVYSNQLTSLDVSNLTNLEVLLIMNNPLEYLNIKNGSSMLLPYAYNAGDPLNSSLNFICVDDEEIGQIQGLVSSEDTVVTSYCSFEPGGEYLSISGSSKIDLDSNGCDTNDNVYPTLKFLITDGNEEGYVFSDINGNFNMYVQNGTHTITPLVENLAYYVVSPESLDVNFPEDGAFLNQDFCVVPDGVYNDVELVLVPYGMPIPGFDSEYRLIYKNKGNTVLSGSLSLNYDDDFMDFVSSDAATSSQNTGLLTWNFTDLAPFETRTIQLTMNLNTPTDSEFPLNSDDILTFETEITSGETDETPDYNIFQLNQVVVNSFDPNDKNCLQGNTLDIEKVGEYLHYRIRFENTGTANATNIVVKDALDVTRYDVSSLIPINASHDFVTKISNGNLVEFIFENINLPFDDTNNDGFVVYKVKTLPDLEVGDVIANDAEIYFDFNFPIVTNNEQTTVVEEGLSVDEFSSNNEIKIFPNPTSNILYVKALHQIESIKLFDMTGHLIDRIKITLNNQTASVQINKLSTGFYFLEIQSGKAKSIHKVLKN